MNTTLEIAQSMIETIAFLAKVGLGVGALILFDGIIKEASGEHIIPILLAAFTWVNLRYFRTERPMFYRGSRRMPMSVDRAKLRMQAEIDSVYDEAWFHNLNMEIKNKVYDRLDREHHVIGQPTWNWA